MGGEVDPQLETDVGGAGGGGDGYFGVHYSAAGGHELQAAGGDVPLCTGEVFV